MEAKVKYDEVQRALDLIPRRQAAITPRKISEIEGMEEVERGDYILPRRRLVQFMSKLDAEPGTFHDNLTGEAKAQIRAVILRMSKSRVMWSDDLTAPPLCASDDALVKRDDFADNECGPVCSECPHAEWNGNEPPPCRLVYNFLCVDVDDGDVPFVLSCASTAVRPAKRLISSFVLRRSPFYSREVIISSELVNDDRGKWYVPVFKLGAQTDLARYQALYREFAGVEIQADTESVASEEETPF